MAELAASTVPAGVDLSDAAQAWIADLEHVGEVGLDAQREAEP